MTYITIHMTFFCCINSAHSKFFVYGRLKVGIQHIVCFLTCVSGVARRVSGSVNYFPLAVDEFAKEVTCACLAVKAGYYVLPVDWLFALSFDLDTLILGTQLYYHIVHTLHSYMPPWQPGHHITVWCVSLNLDHRSCKWQPYLRGFSWPLRLFPVTFYECVLFEELSCSTITVCIGAASERGETADDIVNSRSKWGKH